MSPPPYRIREATPADLDVIARHRAGMFADMGVSLDPALERRFRAWLSEMMPAGTYHGWLAERAGPAGGAPAILGGGGLTILPWPPGPLYPAGRVAFVYNVFTEPAHRGLGIARALMEAIHDWCRAAGIESVALNASESGQPLYESLGYRLTPGPMMFLALK